MRRWVRDAALALAMGASAATLGVVGAVRLRPGPSADPERLVWVSGRARCHQGAGAWRVWLSSLPDAGEPEPVLVSRFSGSSFAVLGVPARLGRTLGPEDARPGHDRVAVLSDSLWRRRFAADPAVVGRAVRLDGESYTVVGVMPP